MRDDALRPARYQTTLATVWRRTGDIAVSPRLALPARLARAALRATAMFALGVTASTAAHATGQACQHARVDGAGIGRLTVCVRRQAFDNDIYVLRLDGKTALRGTDDEVARGLFGRIGNRLVAMRCEAEESSVRVSPAVAQALSWQTGVRVQRITDALGSVETGRRCTVRIDGADAGRLTFAFH